MNNLEEKYPHLFNETIWEWGPIRANFILLDQPPPENKISNINLVPRVGEQWVMLQHHNGDWDIAGGTLEPGEHFMQTLKREMLEEAGAEVLSFRLIGAWHCFSLAEKPYRPHLPFPEHYRIVGTGQVRIVHAPLNPHGAEQIAKVECVDLQTAVDNFLAYGSHDLAELYQVVNDLENQ
jgi:8-oxo-dGTP pyrophosphatase MutT (NUDIX family)